VRLAHLGCKGVPSRGGTERVVEALALRQAVSGHEVTVYGSGRFCESTSDYGGVAVVALSTVTTKHLGPMLLQIQCALHALTHGPFDLIHLHAAENAFVLPLLLTRYPVVLTSHGAAYSCDKWSAPAKAAMRSMEGLSVRMPTVATAVAAPHAAMLSSRYGRRVKYIPNGIDREEKPDKDAARRVLAECGLAEQGYLLFAAARVDPTKGCHTLVEALHRLGRPLPLLVVGDLHHKVGYEDQLRELARGLEVVFLPRLDDKGTVLGLVALSRLFVFPSTVEAMSMMLLEALQVGAPVLASDIPENTSVLPPGWPVFRAGDAGDLAGRLHLALAMPEAEKEALTCRGREWVTGLYDWDRIAEAYERVYQEAVRSRAA